MLRFQLPSFDNPHELEFQFEHESQIYKRIAVIIGKNGVGKSQALSSFARSLIRDDKKLRTQDKARPSVNRLIAISGHGETRTTFPTSRVRSRIPYRKIILDLNSTVQTETGLGTVLIQLARSKEKVREHDRWNLFCNAVSSLLKLDELFVRQRRSRPKADSTSEPRPIALADFRPTSEQARLALWGRIDPTAALCRFIDGKILPLSSGESTFIRFAAQACLFIENGTLLLVDEPETHLHPNLITQFVGLLDELLKMTSSFAVLATHSAYFVREVPRSQVLILKENGRRI
ncbi:MAG TPA: AAA family ATPase, partial [Anaerolineales bacterium]|nr:AAA family ATPase [Anaerolineales bacterium]